MGGGAKPFYPALMEMPDLTPEARRIIEAEAGRFLGSGSASITASQTALHHALSANDPVLIQQAAAGVREGVRQVDSGASLLRAVNEGQPPRQIALTWFRGQMNFPAAPLPSMEMGRWGLSWYHLTTMAFLVAFLLGALLIHFSRMRRVAGLIARLTPRPVGAPSQMVTSPAPTPVSPAPATPKVSEVPATTAVPQAALEPVAERVGRRLWSGQVRVAAIFRETPTVKTFRFMDADGGPIPFTFLPGQFLTLSADIDGHRVRRSYTIASPPTRRDYIEITVKREEQGAESRFLHDQVKAGMRLDVVAPSGVFTFTEGDAESIVLIAGGVGITPMMCITRYLTDRAFPGDIFFLYGARTTQDFIFREELEYLQKRHSNLHVMATMARAEGTAWMGVEAPLSQALIASFVPDIARRRVHVCGPPPMMEAIKGYLTALGVPGNQIKTEAFGPALGAKPPPTVPAPAPTPAAVRPAPAVAAPSAQAQIEFRKSGKAGPLAPDQSVLEAAEALGVAIDFSCRVGTCGTCMVPLLEGIVTMEVEDGLPPADKARGMILACQAKSVGRLVVDA
ncbi:MAG: 2Fe-2S iron-sulfur cluster binding domain-containing protein [Nitrospira sp.]|nr:2Fe-2S iron-sulfur cluster binding domain-containing protein [Nitrospira sp.]